jgi:hypothetical protein
MDNFNEAIEHLNVCSEAYSEVGSAGMFCMIYVITPLRDRVNKGERSQELYDEIMEIQL